MSEMMDNEWRIWLESFSRGLSCEMEVIDVGDDRVVTLDGSVGYV